MSSERSVATRWLEGYALLEFIPLNTGLSSEAVRLLHQINQTLPDGPSGPRRQDLKSKVFLRLRLWVLLDIVKHKPGEYVEAVKLLNHWEAEQTPEGRHMFVFLRGELMRQVRN
jgi:hypothetical protein